MDQNNINEVPSISNDKKYDWDASRLATSNAYQNAVSEQATRIEQGVDMDLVKRSNTRNALKAQAGGASLAMIRNIDAFNGVDFDKMREAGQDSASYNEATRYYGRAKAGLNALMSQLSIMNGGRELHGELQRDNTTGRIIGVNLTRDGVSSYKTFDQFKDWANKQFGVAPTEQQLSVENFEKEQKQQRAMRMINGLATIEKAKDFLSGAYYAYKNASEDDPNRAQYETQWNNARNMLVNADVDPDLIDAYMSTMDANAARKAKEEDSAFDKEIERDRRKAQNTITIAEAAEARRVAREAEKMKTPQGMLDIVNKQIEAWKGLPPDTPGRDAQIKSLLLTQKNIAEAAGIPYVEVGDVDDDDAPTGDLSEGL